MQKVFIRILFLSGLFFSNLWSMSTTQISNALDLARNIFLVSSGSTGGATVPPQTGPSRQQPSPAGSPSGNLAPQPAASGQQGPSTSQQSASSITVVSQLLQGANGQPWLNSQPWLAATINGVTYFIFGSVSLPAGWVALPNLSNALKGLSAAQWGSGVYVTVVQNNNQCYLVALDSKANLIAADALPNVTSLASNTMITWEGAYIVSPPKLSVSQAFGLTTGATSNLLTNITLNSSVLQSLSVATAPVVYDLKNQQLTELMITIDSTKLPFIVGSAENAQVYESFEKENLIPCLSFVPSGTDEFTIKIYGYNGSTMYNTLSDLQAAITANSQSIKFGAYVYDKNNQPLGSGVDVPASLVTPLIQSFASNTKPSLSLSVNLQTVTQTTVAYPISVTLQNIANWGQFIHDMQNTALTEINIDIAGTPLTFVASPAANFPLISDLGFIPTGTTSFTLEIYGYGASTTFETLSDLQVAINNNTLQGFEAQVYDVNKPIGSPIPIPSNLATSLQAAFKSGTMPTSDLGVNSNTVPGIAFSYPISLTLQNILGWTAKSGGYQGSAQSGITNLSKFMSTYSIPSANIMVTPVSWSGSKIVPAWNMNINNSSVAPGVAGWSGGYAFVNDPWNRTTAAFVNGKGVAADISPIDQSMAAALQSEKLSIALIATDSSGTYISDLTKTAPTYFYLYAFDQTDTIIGQPISFNASNAVGLTTSLSFLNNQFLVGGLGLPGPETLTYPFVFTLTNKDLATASTPVVTKIDLTGLTPAATAASILTTIDTGWDIQLSDSSIVSPSPTFVPTQNYLVLVKNGNPVIKTNDAVINIPGTLQIQQIASSDFNSILPTINTSLSSLQSGQYLVFDVANKNLNLYVLSVNK